MAFFQMKVDEKVYTVERLTLGECRMLKRDFGLTDFEIFSASDPEQMAGLLVVALMQEGQSQEDATKFVMALDIELIDSSFEPEPDEDEADPTPAVAGAAEDDGNAPSGESGKPRKKHGSPS